VTRGCCRYSLGNKIKVDINVNSQNYSYIRNSALKILKGILRLISFNHIFSKTSIWELNHDKKKNEKMQALRNYFPIINLGNG
jgi:hypothetical protein